MTRDRFPVSTSRPDSLPRSARLEPGFTLFEVTVALLLLAVAIVSLSQLVLVARASSQNARRSDLASILAAQKMEQLRGLAWGYDPQGTPREDRASDIAAHPEREIGGVGLAFSPPGVLDADLPGFFDHLDAAGRWMDGGGGARASYVRRWSVQPLPDSPAETLILRVRVLRSEGRALDIVTLKTRRAQ